MYQWGLASATGARKGQGLQVTLRRGNAMNTQLTVGFGELSLVRAHHHYKRGIWLRWSAGKPLAFAYVGQHWTINYRYFFNV